ncbi:Uncharacterised protein [Bordetella pertussis]|nr:Uncharacterised protein [Bordetella pertussis]CFM45929.1 Uncharacterised protein [Bordetella pertussis]CFM91861.1 Uncharacterised protein [Bordetella pertussis]CFN19906.1 Uncharacterised protein [Bordetella pertussis]CFN61835.1 Uncharacterised protein [Bordetella pertussis]
MRVYSVYGKAGYSSRPPGPLPLCNTCQKSSALQPPMPVSASGVMFGPYKVPNGVGMGVPPA